jgi:glutamyl-tRNA synthetase
MWIRDELTDEQLADRLQDWALNRESLLSFLPFARQRMETFSDLAPLGSYLLSGMLPISAKDLTSLGMEDQLLEVLQYSLWRLETVQNWNRDNIFSALESLADGMNIKLKPFLAPLFIAITGSTASISVMDSMNLLGADMSRARLRHAIELLGGVGKKKLKKMEKAYQAIS